MSSNSNTRSEQTEVVVETEAATVLAIMEAEAATTAIMHSEETTVESATKTGGVVSEPRVAPSSNSAGTLPPPSEGYTGTVTPRS